MSISSPKSSQWLDRSVIITGGASGIGRAAAELLASNGAIVTIADLDAAAGETALASVKAAGGGQAQFVRTDVADETAVRGLVDSALALTGRLDGAINSAGVLHRGKPVQELSVAEWDFCMSVNLRGMFLCIKYQIAAMLKSGGGAICAVSSTAAIMAFSNSPDYCASKAGVTGLVRSVAYDYGRHGIRCNALLPGATDTPLSVRARALRPPDAPAVHIPSARRAQPDEMARSAVWMISQDASYMNGASVSVDGGMSIA
jgi:NAD(P)-dependent dehydrogenase (short-subunit alcohol dehydrogenase family)